MRAAIDGYKHDSDKIGQFIEEVLVPDPNGEERTAAVHREYVSWCRRNNYKAEGSGNFNQALGTYDDAQIVRKRPRGGGSETTLLLGYTLPNRGYFEQQILEEAIAKRYGGLEQLGDKLLKSENFELALDEIVWLLTLLANQSILIHNLRNKSAPRDLLTEEEMELLTSPLDLASYKNAITEAMMRGTARNVLSEGSGTSDPNPPAG